MNWLIPYFIFKLGFLPFNQTPDDIFHQDFCTTEIIIGGTFFNLLHFEGEIKTIMRKITWTVFKPHQEEYSLRAFVKHKGFIIGLEHSCFHPVETTELIWQYEGGHNKIYIEFDSRGF